MAAPSRVDAMTTANLHGSSPRPTEGPERRLNLEEARVIVPVFERTIPYRMIRIHPGVGLGGRPFTLPAWNGGTLARYRIYAGPLGYGGMERSAELQRLLVHEVTHVWQSVNGAFPTEYVFKDLPALFNPDGYGVTPGLAWDQYNPEQQATLVAAWAVQHGRSRTNAYFPYIRDHILKGRIVFP